MKLGLWLDRGYFAGIAIKGIDGLLETAGGFLVWLRPGKVSHLIAVLTMHEVVRGHDDFILRHLMHFSGTLAEGGSVLVSAYLLTHGLAKVVLVVALFLRKVWAYGWMIALLGVFVVYQTYRIAYRQSLGLVLFTAFDALVMWLTWREYRNQKNTTAECGPAE